MQFAEFERRAAAVWDEIPEEYRSGVDGLVIEREPKAHPSLDDIYTLGECLTESYPSDWGGPDTTRSVLVLYYGSFQRLSDLDPDFDWRYEIWETVTHELRHHLESLATEDALEDVDYAMDENFKRLQGEPFDPLFHRSGEPIAPGVFVAEREVFVEREFRGDAPPFETVDFEWDGAAYQVEIPTDVADVTFVEVVEGIESQEVAVCVVLVRKPGAWAALRRWLRGEGPSVAEAEAVARRTG